MATKIRLQRFGRKDRPYYHIVVADSRAKRDGRFIERLGSYDSTREIHYVKLDIEKAVDWIMKGAQPTDTVRSIFSKKGVLLKKHLLEGVKKNALTPEQANEKFNAWLEENENKATEVAEHLDKKKLHYKQENLKREAEKNEARIKTLKKAEAKRLESLKKEISENQEPEEEQGSNNSTEDTE